MSDKKRKSLLNPDLIFIAAQLAWFALVTLWILWFVSSYVFFTQVEKTFPIQIGFNITNLLSLIVGLTLLGSISVGMALIFRNLNRQRQVTATYDKFIANITHELKSPLASIQLYLETLRSRDVPEETRNSFYEIMLKDASRLNNLISSILEISRIEDRRFMYSYQLYRADTLLKSILEESRVQFNLPKDSMTVTGDVSCYIRGDRKSLLIVFNNLLDNSIKYSSDPVSIIISIKTTINSLIIDFSDNGIGIPVQDQKQVFNKFNRLYHTENPSVQGTGLGLYMVKEIIRMHKGKISVFSEGKNLGTTFKIELPIRRIVGRRP
jgi:two-component system, OmpR family, phosphate regulon sensor histidine kinase PhoR